MSFWRKILVSMKSQSRNSLPRTSGTSPPCRHSAKGHGIDMVSWSDNVGLTTHRAANVPGQIIRMNARRKKNMRFCLVVPCNFQHLFGLEVCSTVLFFCIRVYLCMIWAVWAQSFPTKIVSPIPRRHSICRRVTLRTRSAHRNQIRHGMGQISGWTG